MNTHDDAGRRKGRGLGRTATVLTAAATIAAGSAISYAVASTTTNRPVAFSNTGRGPAISLHNRSAYPPLAVNSSKRVAHLNADMVDGRSAAQLEPGAFLLRMSKRGGELQVGTTTAIASGWYEVTLHVVAGSRDNTARDATCSVYPDEQLTNGDYTNLLSAHVEGERLMYLSAAGALRFNPDDQVVVRCETTSGVGTVELLNPITVSLRPMRIGHIERAEGR